MIITFQQALDFLEDADDYWFCGMNTYIIKVVNTKTSKYIDADCQDAMYCNRHIIEDEIKSVFYSRGIVTFKYYDGETIYITPVVKKFW